MELRKDLHERVDLVAGKDALRDVGVSLQKGPGILKRGHLQDDKTTSMVGKGAGQQNLAGLVQTFHPVQVSLAMKLSFLLTIRAVVPDDHEDHAQSSFRVSMDRRPAYPSSTS